jgi:hypothetical protein
MLTPDQIESKLDRILLKVQKPGRYVGGELNITVKDWDAVKTRVALVFPDIYDIGVSNVGLKILYDQVNQRDDALAERAYAPWVDMEAQMRANGIPLYALESKRPLACFDIIGFSLPYETLYTNALNVLDLSGIPVYPADRAILTHIIAEVGIRRSARTHARLYRRVRDRRGRRGNSRYYRCSHVVASTRWSSRRCSSAVSRPRERSNLLA